MGTGRTNKAVPSHGPLVGRQSSTSDSSFHGGRAVPVSLPLGGGGLQGAAPGHRLAHPARGLGSPTLCSARGKGSARPGSAGLWARSPRAGGCLCGLQPRPSAGILAESSEYRCGSRPPPPSDRGGPGAEVQLGVVQRLLGHGMGLRILPFHAVPNAVAEVNHKTCKRSYSEMHGSGLPV